MEFAMKRWAGVFVVVAFLSSSGRAQPTVAGDWVLTLHDGFASAVMRLSLTVMGEKLTGTAGGQAIEGAIRGTSIEFTRQKAVAKGALDGEELKGNIVFPDRTATWTAVRIPPRPPSPRTHMFEPSEFHLYFSSKVPPALRIHAGDTVRTWSVDAGGRDPKGNRRSAGGNPQTGPFYVEGAMPNDTLIVRLNRVRTNRDWAQSGSTIMRNALEPGTLDGLKWDPGFNSRWRIDTTRNVAFLEAPAAALKNFTVPLLPMLGCVAVAPQGDLAIRTTDSGRFGGNMDYNQIREGTTLYLPVSHPGALLFVGDGHAAQGDGELTGDALETSMDIEFTVDLIRDRSFGHPLAENSEFLISIGIGGSLDQALQQATSGMVRWLDRDYRLAPSEAAMLLGFAVRYDVVDLVGTQVSIAAKLPKSALAQLPKAPPAQ
jgi:acetamidase/formamidase